MRLVVLVVALAACNREGDHCQAHSKRCDGETLLVCQIANSKLDVIGHKSNYYERTECPAGTRCIKVGGDADCANPADACDQYTTKPTVKDTDSAYEVRSCTHHINTNAYWETGSYTKCDPKTFKPACLDGQSASACVAGETLEGEQSAIKEALRDKYVETRTYCAVCGDPTTCNK
jgi:hypothetical protein